jgi:hypothetical protein
MGSQTLSGTLTSGHHRHIAIPSSARRESVATNTEAFHVIVGGERRRSGAALQAIRAIYIVFVPLDDPVGTMMVDIVP